MTATTSIYPADEAEKDSFATKPIGLGPFKFIEHVPGSRFVAERFEKFYKPGKPYADKVVIAIMGEAAARDVAFRNKEIDTSILGPAQYVAYRADPKLSKGILEVAEMFTRDMGMNPSFKPFADKRVRQAINHAIDTDLIIKRLVKDKAYPRDQLAAALLARLRQGPEALCLRSGEGQEAPGRGGLSRRVRVRMDDQPERELGHADRRGGDPDAGQGRHQGEDQAGRGHGADGSRHARATTRPISGSQTSGPDPLATLNCFHSKTPRIGLQLHHVQERRIRQAPRRARRAMDDPAKRNDLLRKANNMIYDEAPVWFFNYNKAVLAYQPWIHGLQANPTEITHPVLRGHLGRRKSSPAK